MKNLPQLTPAPPEVTETSSSHLVRELKSEPTTQPPERTTTEDASSRLTSPVAVLAVKFAQAEQRKETDSAEIPPKVLTAESFTKELAHAPRRPIDAVAYAQELAATLQKPVKPLKRLFSRLLVR
jgi:hypothetical protein